MKKLFLAGAAVLTLGAGAYSVYADGTDSIQEEKVEYIEEFRPGFRGGHRAYEDTRDMTNEERDAWFDEMHRDRREYQEEQIELDLEASRITEEEEADWREDIEENERYYEENGRPSYDHHGYRRNRNNRRGYGHCH